MKRGGFSFNSPERREEDDREYLSALVCAECVVTDIPGIDKIMSALLTRLSRGGLTVCVMCVGMRAVVCAR